MYDALSDSFYNANALGESGIIEPGANAPAIWLSGVQTFSNTVPTHGTIANTAADVMCCTPGNMLPGGSEGLAWLPFSSATRFLGGGHNMIRSFGRSVEGSPQHNSFNSQSSVDDNFPQHRRTEAPKDR